MICLVCDKQFEKGASCPRCGFPVINSTDPGKVREQYAGLLNEYKQKFLKTIEVSVVHYLWKDSDGYIKKNKAVSVPLGTGTKLYKNEVFEDIKLARVPDLESIDVDLLITAGKERLKKTVSVPNIPSPELQQLGIAMHYDFSCELILRTESGRESHSKSFKIFE